MKWCRFERRTGHRIAVNTGADCSSFIAGIDGPAIETLAINEGVYGGAVQDRCGRLPWGAGRPSAGGRAAATAGARHAATGFGGRVDFRLARSTQR
jgi:hypothetical protein